MEFNRFDVSTKELVWDDPAAWLRRLGIDVRGPVEVIDSDITALTASADKVIRIGGGEPYLVNIEFQSSHDSQLARTLWFRQVALDHRNGLPVLTILVLLRKEANSPSLSGVYERFLPDGRPTNRYHYQVVRLWRESADSFLNAEVELIPLAPLCDVEEQQLPGLVQKISDRFSQLEPARAAKLWTTLYLMMGLRFPDEVIGPLLEGVQAVQDSSTYQKILRDGEAKGRTKEARRMLLRQGIKRFGTPDAEALAALEGIQDINLLEELGDRILDADLNDWNSFLRIS